MKGYLLDTNICIYYMKGRYDLEAKFKAVDPTNCYISEITVAELKYGVENSDRKARNQTNLENFLSGIQIIPIFDALDTYAIEKARLKKIGQLVDDFDLLIGATAITYNLIMVTNNSSHFERLQGIVLEDWTK